MEILLYLTLIQASFMRSIDDVHPKADGYIVGEHLEDFVKTL